MSIAYPMKVRGFNDSQSEALGECLSTLSEKRSKNMLLTTYYESKQVFRDLGISIPPQLTTIEAALGWPARAVHSIAKKHRFEGFSVGGNTDPFGVAEVMQQNMFEASLKQAITSAYKHSCSFLVVTAGDASEGEPDAVITARDAESVGAVWDSRRQHIKHAAVVLDTDEAGQPNELWFTTRLEWFLLSLDRGEWLIQDQGVNASGRPMIEPLRNDPQINRPFGRSRITREVRYLTDAAIRAMIRGETTAEFFTSPQRYVLGAEESAFADADRWSAITGRVMALGLNDDGSQPSVGQFPAQSPDQIWSTYRQLAQNFCAATGIPPAQVGIFADNPTSAEAMIAAESELSSAAEDQWDYFDAALLRTLDNVANVVYGHENRELHRVSVNHEPAAVSSPSSRSNWAIQAVQADPTLQGSSVVRRRLGLSQGEIDEVNDEQSRSAAPGVLAQLLGGSTGEVEVEGVDDGGADQPA